MEALFLKVVNLSVTASWVIAAVLLLRLLMRSVLRKYTCLLWLVVLFRLLCPVSLEAEFSLVPQHTAIQPEIVYTTPQVDTQSAVVNDIADATVNPILTEHSAPTPQNSANPLQIYLFAASWLWVLGIVILCGYTLFSWLRLRRQLREAVPDEEGIYLCDAIPSPFVFGIVRPRIYLPYGLRDAERRYVLLHERSHIARWDFLLKPLFWLAVMVHWLNPLVWVAWHYFSRDLELACDERAISQLNGSQKQGYSHTLVQLAVQQRKLRCPIAFGNNSTKQRIAHVLRYKKQALWITGVALVITVMMAVALGVNPVPTYRLGELQPELAERAVDQAYIQWGCVQVEVTEPADVQALQQLLVDTEVQPKGKAEWAGNMNYSPYSVARDNCMIFAEKTDPNWASGAMWNGDYTEMEIPLEGKIPYDYWKIWNPERLQNITAKYGKDGLAALADTTTIIDLNQDGVDEQIIVNPKLHLLAIYGADDVVWYTSEKVQQSDGSFYLCTVDEKTSLLYYNIAVNEITGDGYGGSWLWEFDHAGERKLLQHEEIDFGLYNGVGEAEDEFDAQKVYEFLQKVDALAQEATLLYYEDSRQHEQLYSTVNKQLGYDEERHLSWLPEVPGKADADVLERLEYMERSLRYDLQKGQLQQWLKEQGKFNYRQHELIRPVMLKINQRECVGFTLLDKDTGNVLGKYAISAQNPQNVDDKQRGHLYYWFHQATEEWTLVEDTSVKLLR